MPPPYEPEATPQQQEAVRRLLAESSHREPLPPEVAARLDGVLAGLVAEGPRAIDPPPPAPHQAVVVDLGARRRRRVVSLLGAAAAVVVVGVGVTQVVDTSSGGDSSADSSAADAPEAAADAEAEAAEPSKSAQEAAPGVPPPAGAADMPASVPPISADSFGDAVLGLRPAAVVQSSDRVSLSGGQLTSAPMFVCDATSWGDGLLLAVRYAGNPAVLAYRPPVGDTQVVDLLQCGTAEVVRSTTIPYP